MSKREFLQLAHDYDPVRHFVAGWLESEKLDGMRCFWDGGITRGLYTDEIPWANTAKDTKRHIATGLWSRYGKVIHCPKWWLDTLPNVPLDGELWCGFGQRQLLRSIVATHESDPERWKLVKFCIIDSPNLDVVFANGIISSQHYKKSFNDIAQWIKENKRTNRLVQFSPEANMLLKYRELYKDFNDHKIIVPIKQTPLPLPCNEITEYLEQRLLFVKSRGGEGLILRKAVTPWIAERTWDCLKIKAPKDSEAVIIGYNWGKETEKGSKLLGLMGSIIVRWNDIYFKMSGFKEEERVMHFGFDDIQDLDDVKAYGSRHEGETITKNCRNPLFPRGSMITFTYHGLTDRGVPIEARYLRKPIT